MKRYAKLLAFLIFSAVASVTFIAGVTTADKVGDMTHSGMLGICGPYGPHADLVGSIFLGSIPVSLGVGMLLARRFYRWFSR